MTLPKSSGVDDWGPAHVTQEHLHEQGAGVPGDCWRCCIAAVLGLSREDVPHFARYSGVPGEDQGASDPDDLWWWATLGWLGSIGLWLREYDLVHEGQHDTVQHALADIDVPGPYLLVGKSPRGDWSHVVVAHRGKIAWDPHPSRAGLRSASSWTEFLTLDECKSWDELWRAATEQKRAA